MLFIPAVILTHHPVVPVVLKSDPDFVVTPLKRKGLNKYKKQGTSHIIAITNNKKIQEDMREKSPNAMLIKHQS